jgi:hypothetical protein
VASSSSPSALQEIEMKPLPNTGVNICILVFILTRKLIMIEYKGKLGQSGDLEMSEEKSADKDEEEEEQGYNLQEGDGNDNRRLVINDEGEGVVVEKKGCVPCMWNCYEYGAVDTEGEGEAVERRAKGGMVGYLFIHIIWGSITAGWRYIIANRYVVYSILTYEVFCLAFDTGDEVVPVWTLAEADKGEMNLTFMLLTFYY